LIFEDTISANRFSGFSSLKERKKEREEQKDWKRKEVKG